MEQQAKTRSKKDRWNIPEYTGPRPIWPTPDYIQGGPQKLSHYQRLSLSRN